MTPVLRASVHAAMVDDALVLLDLEKDDYLCLPGAGHAVAAGEGGALKVEDACIAGILDAAGLLGAGPVMPGKSLPERPRSSIIHEPAEHPPTLRMWLDGLLAAVTVRKVRRRAGVKDYLALAGGADGDRNPVRVAEAARAFWRLGPWLPIDGECLVRSALLMRFLQQRGLEADWVFGVRLWPFTAHCWVQLDGVCLNDDVERLISYTPIYCR
ncbi:lasso peptide biosynthesis B2 protein [Brevundimonas vesicularis]|uniref:lasso peptide biosynthesis B2 protein n=1 Tax=Brevundimonas vesicularis TaxID=41276 RepID=UPI0038D4E12B